MRRKCPTDVLNSTESLSLQFRSVPLHVHPTETDITEKTCSESDPSVPSLHSDETKHLNGMHLELLHERAGEDDFAAEFLKTAILTTSFQTDASSRN